MAKVKLTYASLEGANVQPISLEYPVIDEDEFTVVADERKLDKGALAAGAVGLFGALALMVIAWLTGLGSTLLGGVSGAIVGTAGTLVPGIAGWLPLETSWVVGGAIAGLLAGVVISLLAALVRHSPRRTRAVQEPAAVPAT